MQDATRQGKILSFFLMKRKESCARKIGGGEKEGEGRGGKCLTFFKGIINSLSALVIIVLVACVVYDVVIIYLFVCLFKMFLQQDVF